jgi:ubiquinol-cytochrome c reductase cytochrome b subunit
MSATAKLGGGTAKYVDDRVAAGNFVRRSINKIFPDHWSFMLGEIALYSFIVLLLSGTWLAFFFKPSVTEVVYDGRYGPLKGVEMSQAFASTLEISFDVRGGLVMRQIHHWAALIFVAAICVHLFRVFFTGGFRKPREFNWILGIGLLTFALLEGFAGYSLPDDLLSGTGLRIAHGVTLSLPVVGTYLAFFIFGGEFPGDDFIPRLYAVHILLVPGILLALITAHIMLVWYQKHTQFPGPGRTERNVVGYPFFPHYTAKAGGFFFIVFGVTSLLGAFVQINPIWMYGSYKPSEITAGSQPDWYIGFLEGSLRAMPNWETNLWGHTISWNVLVPAMILPGLMMTALALYPFIEAWVTGDKREHHILDRPRNQPVRTGLGVMAITFYGLLWINGGNDIIADKFHLSINLITWTTRISLVALPPIVFVITKRICLGLQRRDRALLLHGRETGIVKRLPSGEMIEVHEPIPAEAKAKLLTGARARPAELPPAQDENGIPRPGTRRARIRAKVSNFYYADRIEQPTEEELAAHSDGHGHDHELEELPADSPAELPRH